LLGFNERPVGKDRAASPWQAGRSGPQRERNRRFIDAVLWTVKTHLPWCDLPAAFGDWNTLFKRVDDCPKAGVFEKIFNALSDDPDMDYAMIDATIVPVHRHGHRAPERPKIRRSTNPKAAGPQKSSP
jgi:transposase